MVNEELGVSLYKDNRYSRYACQIHVGNKASELAGCVAPGLRYGCLGNEFAVLGSKTAFHTLDRLLMINNGGEGHHIFIQWDRPEC